ncbi:hypothetical protein pqer_cds_815 [Pandoravirus quercus]|uniref:F-box incomplete domain containing protein n=1 Tax=Pandoravirus quercus TaxID=2107709 RepID=A0A2U7U9W1_9VIRU|nr:hypothetical protein pqer_cds_815 [Pandoravirus quercus]AVK75237.1 hypothetical protein pqer_cds_815 [Pandoravirus quercus]
MQEDADANDNDNNDGSTLWALLPIELVALIVNGRDRHGRAFMDPRWRPMARMACRLLRAAVEHPTPWDSDALGDPQRFFRYPMVGAGDHYVDFDTTHARRRRWRRGMLVCASAVAEWLRDAPMDLTGQYADAMAERMVAEWGASRAQAHVVFLATGRSDTVAYALDPMTSASFAPIPAVPARPGRALRPHSVGWLPDGQELAYAMLDVAVRRCSVNVLEAVVGAIDALYPDGDPNIVPRRPIADDDDWVIEGDIDGYRLPERRGLWRSSFHMSIVAFDRADVARITGRDYARLNGTAYAIAHGAANCIRHHLEINSLNPESAHRLLAEGITLWAEGRYYAEDMGVVPSASRAMDVIPTDVITPEHRKAIVLAAIRDDDVALIMWTLDARDHEQVSASTLFDATGLTATDLVCRALSPLGTGRSARQSRSGVGHLAGMARAAAWLCDVLAYTPAAKDMAALARACIEQDRHKKPECCVARVAFALARWPRLLWESGHGVPLVREAFVSCVTGWDLTPDAMILIDAIETWCDALGMERKAMRDTLALFCSMIGHGGSFECVRHIGMALQGSPWTKACSAVCYGTCREPASGTSQGFCNGRSRSDADIIAAWCLPTFSPERWPV